ncbi:hypothetical protein ACLB2K_054782 [Fragaria x ananassa]
MSVLVRLDYEKRHGLYEACGFFNHGGGGCDRLVETELKVLLKLAIVQLEVAAVSTVEQIVVTSVGVIPIGTIICVQSHAVGHSRQMSLLWRRVRMARLLQF